MLGNLAAGALADRHGEGRVLAAWSVLAGAAFWLLYTVAPREPSLLFPLYALAGVGVGITAMVPSIAVAAFPAPIRFSGLSFSYNVAYAICGGATGPWITGLLYDHTGNYLAAFWIALVMSVLSAAAIFIAAPRKVRAVAGRIGR